MAKKPVINGRYKDVVHDFTDNLPWSKMSDSEAAWAANFSDQYLDAAPAENNPHRSEIWAANNGRNNDVWLSATRIRNTNDEIPLCEFVESVQQSPATRQGKPRPKSSRRRRFGTEDYGVASDCPEDGILAGIDAPKTPPVDHAAVVQLQGDYIRAATSRYRDFCDALRRNKLPTRGTPAAQFVTKDLPTFFGLIQHLSEIVRIAAESESPEYSQSIGRYFQFAKATMKPTKKEPRK